MRSDMQEGPVPLEVTPLVWVFLSVLSIVVLVTIIIGASFRVSAACSNRLRAKDATAATASRGHFKNGGGGGYPAEPPEVLFNTQVNFPFVVRGCS